MPKDWVAVGAEASAEALARDGLPQAEQMLVLPVRVVRLVQVLGLLLEPVPLRALVQLRAQVLPVPVALPLQVVHLEQLQEPQDSKVHHRAELQVPHRVQHQVLSALVSPSDLINQVSCPSRDAS